MFGRVDTLSLASGSTSNESSLSLAAVLILTETSKKNDVYSDRVGETTSFYLVNLVGNFLRISNALTLVFVLSHISG